MLFYHQNRIWAFLLAWRTFLFAKMRSVFRDRPLSDDQSADTRLVWCSEHTYSCLTMLLVFYFKCFHRMTAVVVVHSLEIDTK